VLSHVTNPGVQQFFELEFEHGLAKRSDALSPILNKVGPWLTYPELCHIIGQTRSAFSVRELMDQGKILLVRVPQGVLGEEISNLLGALIVAKVQLAAQNRADAPEERRRPFYLYVDEFQNFATSSFAKILTEARAFKLGLVCANQYPEQLSKELQLAIAHNVGTTVSCYREGGDFRLRVQRLESGGGTDTGDGVLTPAGPLSGGDSRVAQLVRMASQTRYGKSCTLVESQLKLRSAASMPSSRIRVVHGVDVDEY